ncbi:pyrroline-5-carboxylate reductase family protein [Companilactobacillus mishanensis]|uniref:Pyrroline-5-carboxylate reductase n=1 Tax=Companilactobacillus mishanensis TaxID=2486008 RepID=A0A5P0ZIC6_9LACO|nr:pyrroline-5-carboxylate reductase [Companilactobacillus mishanensis]MQS52819.1 pyrroline-5-carboxylate reductase [Companilactobacillus mishanensis]
MTKKLYSIGGGQMAEAIIRAVIKNKVFDKRDITINDISDARRTLLENSYGIATSENLSNNDLAAADIIMIAVRPQDDLSSIAKKIKQSDTKAAIVSIVAGVTIDKLEHLLDIKDVALARIIPNTLTDTGFGYTGASLNDHIEKEQVDAFFKGFGKVEYIPEELIDTFTGYAVAGPNYVYNFYKDLCNAGVLAGLNRELANKLALENLKGAAAMLEQTGKHPSELLDINNSAGGVGINAQYELDNSDFSAGIQRAVMAAVRTTKELGK